MTIFLGCLCWLIINKTLAQPLFRGCLYSRDTCLGPDGVQWIEVPVYYELLVLHCTLPMHINFFDSCYFLLTGTSLSVRWKYALRKRYARCGVRLPWRGFWTVDVKFVLNYFRKLTLDDLDWAQMNLFITCELTVPDNLFDNKALGKTLFVSVLDREYLCKKPQLLPGGCAFVDHYFRNVRCKIPN